MPTPSPLAVVPSGTWAAVLLVLAAALPVALATRPLLVRLPEPAEPDGKLAYRALPTARFVGACTVLAALAALVVAASVPASAWPVWWVLCAPALVLVAVDARTTWLPLGLTRLVQGAAAGAAVLAGLLGGAPLLLRAAVGAVVAGLLYLLLWRLSGRALGFGDVRLAPVLGAAAGAVDWSVLVTALLLGSVVGAAVGVVRLLARRPGAFAYAPSMLVGAFLACAVRAVRAWTG